MEPQTSAQTEQDISKIIIGILLLMLVILLAAVGLLLLNQSSQSDYIAQLRQDLDEYSRQEENDMPEPPTTTVDEENNPQTDEDEFKPETEPNPDQTSPDSAEYVYADVYFVNPETFDIVASPRRTTRSDIATFLIEQMLLGPESGTGLVNNLGLNDGAGNLIDVTSPTQARSLFAIRIVGGNSLEVAFNKPLYLVGDFTGSLAFNQLKTTLTQFANIDGVFLTANGDACWDDASGLCLDTAMYSELPSKNSWKKFQDISYTFTCDDTSLNKNARNVLKLEWVGSTELYTVARDFAVDFPVGKELESCKGAGTDNHTYVSATPGSEGQQFYQYIFSEDKITLYIGY